MKSPLHCSGRFRDLTSLGQTPLPWTHVATLGEFPGTVEIPAGYDVPGHGVVAESMSVEGMTVFDASVLERLVQRFEGDILIDADHLSHESDQSTEALGWGQALRYGADRKELELETAWTPPGKDKITTQVYRYISPEFSGSVRFEGGVFKFYPSALTGAGLTNRPKLTALRPVSANRDKTPTANTTMDYKTELCKALGLDPATATDADILAKLGAESATSQNRNKRLADLETELTNLRAEAIDRDLETFSDVIEDKEAAKELLQMNRDATVKFFKAAQAKAGGKAPEPLYQRNRATAPNGEKFAAASADEEEKKEGQRAALVATVKNREKCDFQSAWTIAKAEKPELF